MEIVAASACGSKEMRFAQLHSARARGSKECASRDFM
jgi:hypothetical protein